MIHQTRAVTGRENVIEPDTLERVANLEEALGIAG